MNETQTAFAIFYAVFLGTVANVQPRWKAFNFPLLFLMPSGKKGYVARRLLLSLGLLSFLPVAYFSLALWRLSGPASLQPWTFLTTLAIVLHGVVPAFAAFSFYRFWIASIEFSPTTFYLPSQSDLPELVRCTEHHIVEPTIDQLHVFPDASPSNLLFALTYLIVPSVFLFWRSWTAPMTLYIQIVTGILSATLIAGYFFLCHGLPKQPVAPATTENEDAYMAMFSVAHDDIWWAKEHAWTIVTAALATLVAVLLVDFAKTAVSLLHSLSAALVLVAGASNWYVGRMHSDMAIARIRSAFLVQRCPPLSSVVAEVVSGDLSEYNRGAGFMVALIVLTSAVGGISVAVLERSTLAAVGSYFVLLGWGLGALFLQVRQRAAREKAFTFGAA